MRRKTAIALAGGILALCPGVVSAVTRDLAEVPAFRLTFGVSVLNQLSYETYRTPFDELQTRPYNLLFANIGRHPNLTPWPGQEGGHARYVDALIGNNGAANVDNDADAIQGSMIRRETGTIAWGFSAAFLNGSLDSDDTAGTVTFSDNDDVSAYDVRGGAAFLLSESQVLGAGLRVVFSNATVEDHSFEQGVGGFNGADDFQQLGVLADVGYRQFVGRNASWETQLVVGFGSSEKDVFSENIDDTGAVTDRFVITNYDLSDLSIGAFGGYNRLQTERLGEMEFRGGLIFTRRQLDNSDLSFTQTGGVTTPDVTLLGSDPVTTKELFGSAKSVFQAGETEMFLGGRLGYTIVDGSTTTDAAGTIVTESIDDSGALMTLTLGVRQPIFKDKLRILVSGRGDVASGKTRTNFGAGSESDKATVTAAQYAIGLEAVLANVTLDLAWMAGEEAAVVPIPIGLPAGSRRTVDLSRLAFSAAVSW